MPCSSLSFFSLLFLSLILHFSFPVFHYHNLLSSSSSSTSITSSPTMLVYRRQHSILQLCLSSSKKVLKSVSLLKKLLPAARWKTWSPNLTPTLPCPLHTHPHQPSLPHPLSLSHPSFPSPVSLSPPLSVLFIILAAFYTPVSLFIAVSIPRREKERERK